MTDGLRVQDVTDATGCQSDLVINSYSLLLIIAAFIANDNHSRQLQDKLSPGDGGGYRQVCLFVLSSLVYICINLKPVFSPTQTLVPDLDALVLLFVELAPV